MAVAKEKQLRTAAWSKDVANDLPNAKLLLKEGVNVDNRSSTVTLEIESDDNVLFCSSKTHHS